MTELADLGLCESADAIGRGEISAEAYAQALLDRIVSADQTVNAFIRLNADGVLDRARWFDRQTNRAEQAVGGVPLAHKDMFLRAGVTTTFGSAIRRDHVPDITATVLERLDAAGALDLGALNMSEFAQGPTGHNGHFGPCRNPWNPDRVSGGSSSGSGAAVAAGFVPAALGSDTGGSVRIPAACCGVTGLKPTWSRVPRYGAMPLVPSFDCVGVLARSARDCARILRLVAGRDDNDATSSRRPVPDYEAGLGRTVSGTRVGIATTWFLDGVSKGTEARFSDATRALTNIGCDVDEVALPLMSEIAVWSAIASQVEVAAQHAQWMAERIEDYSTQVRARMYPGYAIPGAHYVNAMRQRGPVLQAFVDAVFSRYDVFVTPTLRDTPPTMAESDVDAGGSVDSFLSLSANTRPVSYLGLPAITIPSGPDEHGMPTGLQIVGRPFSEARLLRLAHAFQGATDWHLARPSLAFGAQTGERGSR